MEGHSILVLYVEREVSVTIIIILPNISDPYYGKNCEKVNSPSPPPKDVCPYSNCSTEFDGECDVSITEQNRVKMSAKIHKTYFFSILIR